MAGYYCSEEQSTWANVSDLYRRYGDEFVDKLANRKKKDPVTGRYVVDESEEGRFEVIALALCDAKSLLQRKLACKFSNTYYLNEYTFPSIKLWHIQYTIETLKKEGDCSACDCTLLDQFIECGNICTDDGICLSSNKTFLVASVAHYPCECRGVCGCC